MGQCWGPAECKGLSAVLPACVLQEEVLRVAAVRARKERDRLDALAAAQSGHAHVVASRNAATKKLRQQQVSTALRKRRCFATVQRHCSRLRALLALNALLLNCACRARRLKTKLRTR